MFGEYKITWEFNGTKHSGKAVIKEEGFNMARVILSSDDGSTVLDNLIVSRQEAEMVWRQLKQMRFDVSNFDLREWLMEQ